MSQAASLGQAFLATEDQQQARSLEAFLAQVSERSHLISLHARSAFELGEKLGEGGMGAVYRVRDKRLGRQAALKMLTHEQADMGLKLRFLREASLTAGLTHPAIPPIYEAGMTVEGRLYLLMRVIEGETLAERLASVHRQRASTEDLRGLLGIFQKVCEAVAYAHSQGIVHRDLKPENIMIGEFGEVMVMDWGIARDLSQEESEERAMLAPGVANSQVSGAGGLDTAGLTQQGAFVGTAGYAAPEQVAGEAIDERADVFALGAILAECLTGERAVKGANFQSLVLATQAGELRYPRQVSRSVPKDLDWLCRRCLELDREQRLASAKVLSERISEWTLGHALTDCPYSWVDRALRVFRRSLGVILAASFVLVAMALMAAVWLQVKSEEEQTARAQGVLVKLSEAQDLIDRGSHESEVRGVISELLAFGGRDEEVLLMAIELARKARVKALVEGLSEECVERYPPGYRAYFQWHLSELDGQSFGLTGPLRALIEVAKKRGEDNEFLRFGQCLELWDQGQFERAREVLERGRGEAHDFWYDGGLANVYLKLGRNEQAVTVVSRALECNPRYAFGYYIRGMAYAALNKHGEALRDYDLALAYAPDLWDVYIDRGVSKEKLGDSDGSMEDYLRAVELEPSFIGYHNLGAAYLNRGQLKEALRNIDLALDLKASFVPAICNKALLFERRQQFKAAEACYTEAMGYEPKNASLYNSRCCVRYNLRNYEAALADVHEALKLRPDFDMAYYNWGLIDQAQKRYESALSHYRKALSLNPEYLLAALQEAQILEFQGQYEQALEAYKRAEGLSGPGLAKVLLPRGTCLIRMGRHKEALEQFRAAVIEDPSCESRLRFNRGLAYFQLKDYGAALTDFDEVIKAQPKHSAALNFRGKARVAVKRYRDAVADFEAALALGEESATMLSELGRARLETGDQAGAIEAWQRALKLDEKHAGSLFQLALVYESKKQYKACLELYERCLKVVPASLRKPIADRAAAVRAKLGGG